jgi:4-hydroxybenzoate polyprenyltransferase
MIKRELTKLVVRQLVKLAQDRPGRSHVQPGKSQPASRPVAAPRPVSSVRKYADFVKLSHTVFALPFALGAMVMAARDNHGWPGLLTLGLILAAMVTARTCAMTFNRIVDRKIDQANPRTATRHLPTGQISMAAAWLICVLSAAGFVATAYFINPICFYLSPVALFIICFYSFTKRFTDFSHLYLGIALALAPIGAWLAVRGGITWWPLEQSFVLPLLLGLVVVFWLVGFDIIYAIQDYEFDRRHGLHSLVVRWGIDNALKASFLAHMTMWVLLAVFGLLSGFRLPYLVGLVLILICLVLEHWLARKRRVDWLHIAFFRLNALISVVFFVVTVAEVLFPRFRLIL